MSQVILVFLKTIVDLEIAHMKTIPNVNATVTVLDLIPNVVLEVVDMKTKPNVIPVLTVLDFHIIIVDLEVANMKKARIVNAILTVQDFHFKNVALEAANGIRNSRSTGRENSNTGSSFGTGRKAVIKSKVFGFDNIRTV